MSKHKNERPYSEEVAYIILSIIECCSEIHTLYALQPVAGSNFAGQGFGGGAKFVDVVKSRKEFFDCEGIKVSREEISIGPPPDYLFCR